MYISMYIVFVVFFKQKTVCDVLISDWSSDVFSSDLPECILLDVDFSQSDDVFVGYESNDAHKIEVIESGMDGHAFHEELFFARPYDWIVAGKKAGDPDVVHPTRGVRQLVKRVVHGSNFKIGRECSGERGGQ